MFSSCIDGAIKDYFRLSHSFGNNALEDAFFCKLNWQFQIFANELLILKTMYNNENKIEAVKISRRFDLTNLFVTVL